jgi:hypothetical protein
MSKKRLMLILTVIAVMVATLTTSVVPALAQAPTQPDYMVSGGDSDVSPWTTTHGKMC